MHVGDRVSITDPQRTHLGTVTTVREDGMLTVKWDSGMTERVHDSEVVLLGYQLGAPLTDNQEAIVRNMDEDHSHDDSGYDQDDPKHPSFRERIAAWWDAR